MRWGPVERRVPSWVVVAIGLGLIAVALVGGNGPFSSAREFNRCERADCFGREAVTVVGRRTFVRITRNEDSETRTRIWEVTWQRADGGRTTRDVHRRVYDAAPAGTPATLRIWRGEVVGIAVGEVRQQFTPRVGWTLGGWIGLGWLGLGVILWGLFDRWWDGVFMLLFRSFVWLFAGFMPVALVMGVTLYGWDTETDTRGYLIVLAILVVITAVPAAMLWGTFRKR